MTENLLQDRYGKSNNRSKDRLFAITVASIALVGFLVWAISFAIADANRVSTRDVGYTVNDEYSTEVIFEVSRNPGQEVMCDVQVLNQSFAIVGFKTISVAPSAKRSVVISTVVNTTELGVSGLVAGCR